MHKLLLLGLFLCFSSIGWTQPTEFILRGQLQSPAAEPISYAHIQLLETRLETYSHPDGQFHIKVSKARKNYAFRITAAGYQSQTISFSQPIDSTLKIILQVDSQQLEAIHIIGKKQEQATVVREKLSEQQLAESKGKSYAEVFSKMSAVQVLSTGPTVGKPVIHGLHSNRILMLNQGVRQEGQQWGMEHAPEIDPFSADEFELIKGAQAVRYGADAMAGVLISKSSAIPNDQIHGEADLIGHSNGRGGVANVKLTGGIHSIPNLAWKAQLSGKRFGNSKTANYYLGNTGLSELNYSTQVQYHLQQHQFDVYYSRFGTELGVFYGAHVGTVEDILARIQQGTPLENYGFSYAIQAPKQAVSHQLGRLKYEYRLGKGYHLEAQYAWQQNHRKEFDLRRAVSDDVPMSDMVLTSQTLEALLKKEGHTFGVQAGTQVNNNTPGTGTTPIIPNFDSWTIGLFGLHQQAWNRFTLALGWRYDYRHFDAAGYRFKYTDQSQAVPQLYLLADKRDFHNFSGSLGAKYQFDSQWDIKTTLGLAWRAPTANELYSDGVHHAAGIYEIGNADLKAEQGLKWVNSVQKSGDDFSFQVDGYVQYINNYIYSMPNPDSVRRTIRGTFPVFSYTQHNALFYGLDVNAQWNFISNWSYQFNAGMVRAKNLSLHNYLPYIPSDQLTQGIQWNYKQDSKNYIKLTHHFVARQNRYIAGTDYVAPPAAYQLFSIQASQAFAWGENQATIGLQVENLFNTSYKDYMDRFRYYAHRLGRNFILSFHYNF